MTELTDGIVPDAYDDDDRPRRGRGCLIAALVLILMAGGLTFGAFKGAEYLRTMFADAPDYPGPGQGKVLFEVRSGDSVAEMGRNLKALDVVKSVDAFTAAAAVESDSTGIQVGFYEMKKQMRAEDALAILIDPSNLVGTSVTIPEGLRVVDIVDILAKETDFKRSEYEKVLSKPKRLGLPSYAEGNPEGYLFPSTYVVTPNSTPESILTAMVDRWQEAAEATGLEEAADKLGYTPHELMTIASLVEAEAGRDKDRGKVARVIYNRLETPGYPTFGMLEIDATVNYALGRNLGVALTEVDLAVDSPYNTRKYPGLPPGPIESPGEASMAAAAKATPGPWFFYVTVDLRTGETKFTESYDEFLSFKAEFEEYCLTSEAC